MSGPLLRTGATTSALAQRARSPILRGMRTMVLIPRLRNWLACGLVSVAVVLATQLISDIGYAWLNPRIRMG